MRETRGLQRTDRVGLGSRQHSAARSVVAELHARGRAAAAGPMLAVVIEKSSLEQAAIVAG